MYVFLRDDWLGVGPLLRVYHRLYSWLQINCHLLKIAMWMREVLCLA